MQLPPDLAEAARSRFGARPAAALTPEDAMSISNARRVEREPLTVDRDARPGWITGADRTPRSGEEVFCAAGAATVIRVLGRTSDNSRLLELKLVSGDGKPFFAAASNVLLPPEPVAA
jgi:hypothetical protein